MKQKNLYKEILKQKSLKPSKEVDFLFKDLVDHATNIKNKIILNKKELSSLVKKCGEAEYEMEKHYALKIINSKNPKKELEKFKYYKNYLDLIKLEYLNISYYSKIKNIIFTGSGPLPLSGIILAEEYNLNVTLLENDIEAFKISKELVKILSLKNKIKIINEDAYFFKEYHKYDCIFIAAMVENINKKKIDFVNELYTNLKNDTLLLCRSSHENRKLLYTNIKKDKLIMSPVLEVRPHNYIVNSFLIFQK